MDKRWSKTEIAHLRRHAESQSLEELANRFHTDVETVRRKLEELDLTAEKGGDGPDPEVESYTRALELVDQKKWKKAAEALEKIVEGSDNPQLVDRARQFLSVCLLRLEEEPEEADPYLRAVFEKNRGNLDQALDLCRQQGAEEKEERYAYLVASIQALAGEEDEALEHLTNAIRLEPKNRIHAYHDPDFKALHGREEFVHLIAAESSN